MFKILKTLLSFLIFIFLTGCGQGGPLYLPPAKQVIPAHELNI